MTMSIKGPCKSNGGESTNKNGTTNAVQLKRMAEKPVLMALAPDKFAAKKAANATGGVIMDIMPK